MERCPGLTDAVLLRELWPTLKELSLAGCTGLSAVDALPASLTMLFLTGCTGLSAEAVARVKQALPGCKIHGP